MHVLHRHHLPRATTVTLVAAVLAILLSLALAAGLNDLAWTPAPAGSGGGPSTLHTPATSPTSTLSPSKPLLSAPVPWATARPQPAAGIVMC